jgi:hypothetical protein
MTDIRNQFKIGLDGSIKVADGFAQVFGKASSQQVVPFVRGR